MTKQKLMADLAGDPIIPPKELSSHLIRNRAAVGWRSCAAILSSVFIILLMSAGLAGAQQRTGGNTGGGVGGGGFGGGGNNRSTASSSSSSSSGNSARDYPNSTLPGDASLTYDAETRSIIAMTDENTWTNISRIVASLDKPKPQVLIKVVFVEIQHDNDLDIGIETGYHNNTSPSFLGPAGMVGTSNVFGLAGLGANGQTIGQNTMPYGAGLYSVMTSDFSATLRAIASAQKVEVLSRPSIMVRNNQPATITVGQSVPIITGYNPATQYGAATLLTTYQNVGIILQVTPFISTDGLVEMIVAPQISDLSGQTVQIETNVNLPVIDLRSANTVVVTPDGQTVVIGGLMEKDKTIIDSKIPFLGDIPVLGNLFKHKQTAITKKELMIFLTPHVVRMPSMVAANTLNETKNTNDLTHQDFSDKELDLYFDRLPQKSGQKTTVK